MIDYSKQFSELIERVGEVIIPSLEKEYEKFGIYSNMSFQQAVYSSTYRERVLALPEFKEMCIQIQDSDKLEPLFHVTSRKGWVESALIDYIVLTRAYRRFPEDVYPTKEEVDRAARRLSKDLIVGVPTRRAFAIVDRTILGQLGIELDESVRLRYMSLFEVQSIKHSDFYHSIELPQFTTDGIPMLESICIIEYIDSELNKMGLDQIKDYSVQKLAGSVIQNVAMCLRLYRDTNIAIGNIWISLGNWDLVTSTAPRPELMKAGFPTWDYSREIERTGPLKSGMIPKFQEPILLHGKAIDEFRCLWKLFSRFRNDRPYSKFQDYYQNAIYQYNTLISEDRPDIASNVLSSAIDAFGRGRNNRSSYELLITLLAHGEFSKEVQTIINNYQSKVRNRVEHGERVNEDNYELVYKMGNLFRMALMYAMFLFDEFGVFKDRIHFHNQIMELQGKVIDLIPNWAQSQIDHEFKGKSYITP